MERVQPDFKWMKELRTASARRREGCFLAEGHHLVQEALRWGDVDFLALSVGKKEVYVDEVRQARDLGIPVYEIPESRMKSLSQTTTSQGILAAVRYRHRYYEAGCLAGDGLICILERVQDPGNVGTILRTADALGAKAILLTADSADVTNDKALRASMGAIYRVPVYIMEDKRKALASLKEEGWKIFCGDLHGTDFFSTPRNYPRQAFLVGNEGAGVEEETAALCTHRIRLPMPGHAESLNAAVASSIALYDLAREMGLF